MDKLVVLYVADIPFWGGSTLSLKDMILTLQGRIQPIVLVPEEGDVSLGMKELGVECVIIPYPSDFFKAPSFAFLPLWLINTIRYKLICSKFYKKISEEFDGRQIDIVHSNTSAVDIGFELAQMLHAKHIWHIREMLDTFSYIQFVGRGFCGLKRKMSKADKLIFISSACQEHWNIDLPINKQIVIGDAVRRKTETVYFEEKKKFFLFCSVWLSEFKGTDYAIRAFALSGLVNDGYMLKLIGKYKRGYKKKLDKLSRELNIENSIEYLGLIDSCDVKEYMCRAKAFLQCSKIEGLGRTAIEAMFYGCPVIARNCGGTLDYIRNNETGFLWNTLEDLSAAMKYVVSSDVNNVVIAAQKEVSENYSVELYGDKILNLYNDL